MAKSAPEFQDLIERARKGESVALGHLLDQHRDYLRAIALQQLAPKLAGRLDGSDIVQQTCISVQKQIREFSGKDPAEFVAWLRQIHERNIQNAIRFQSHSQKRSINREEVLDDFDIAGEQVTPSQLVIGQEDSSRLYEAMAKLPDNEREAVRLRYFENWTLQKISEHFDLTIDATVWLMKRSMQHLKQYLRDD